MSLKDILPGKKKLTEYFWALVIEPGWAQAGIWKIDDTKAQVVLSGPPTVWELDEELITASDTALSSAIQSFPEDEQEPEKCVFGVISSWVDSGQIKDEYLEKIKQICTDLSLVPVGFVVLPEAIANLVKNEEGSPLSGVVLGIYKQSLEVTLFKNGVLKNSTEVSRSVSVVDDVAEGLTRLVESGTIPSRFILYNGKEGELEEARQALLKVNWDDFEGLEFLHTPKIELVDAKKKVQAVSLAGASELAGVSDLEKPQEKETQNHKVTPGELGFELEKDVALEKTKEVETESHTLVKDESVEPVDIGESEESLEPISKQARFDQKMTLGLAGKVKKGASSFLNGLKALKRSALSGKKTFVFGLVALFLIIVSGFCFWWYYPKSVITIYISPQSLKEDMALFLDPDLTTSDFSEGILKGEIVKAEVSGEKTRSTTGTKTIGEKAKGEVTIYRVGSELTLPSGTVLNGPDDLKFSLDEEVVVASGSAGSAGSTKAQITAQDIGSQYNLASDTLFTVSNYSTSDLEAKSESSFSGGTSYEIKAVSSEDQESLLADLEEELLEKAEGDFDSKVTDGQIFISQSLTATPSSQVFSDKIGDEASSLKLTLSLETQALVVEQQELLQVSKSVLENRIPEGFVLRDEQLSIDFEFEGEEDGLYEFEATVEANLLPEIDTEKIATAIKGKYPKLAQDYFTKEIAGFVRAEVKIKPTFPGRLNTLPRIAKNIEVIVAAEK